MIFLSIGKFVVLFVGVPLFVLGLLALYYNFRLRYRSSCEKESIYECVNCGHVYAFARNRPMDRCPRCDYLNDAVRT